MLLLPLFVYMYTPETFAQNTLSFDSNSGYGNMSNILAIEDSTISLPTGTFTKPGYHLVAWNTKQDNSGISYDLSDNFTITDNATLFAEWGKYSGGDGSIANPYEIATKEDLILLSTTSDDWHWHFIQTQHIAFNTIYWLEDWNGDNLNNDIEGFTSIGNTSIPFSGTYDAQNYSISNLYISSIQNYQALFGYTNGASITQVILYNTNITANAYSGSLIGKASNNTHISDSHAYGNLQGTAFVAGLVGSLENSSLINCSFEGNIDATASMIGGLVGRIRDAHISNSYSTGYVKGDSQNTGGLVGFAQENSTITNSYSTSGVIGFQYVGGFIGLASSSTIEYCYSTGFVSGIEYVDAFAGINSGSVFSNCIFDETTSWGQSIVAGINPINTEAFIDKNTFNDWPLGTDDTTPWLHHDMLRPTLYWQTTAMVNSVMSNAADGYRMKYAYNGLSPALVSGLRYRKQTETDWIYQLNALTTGNINTTITQLEESQYLVQTVSRNDNKEYYGDMTQMLTYTLAFDKNGGKGVMNDTLLISHDTIQLPALNYEREGYNFEKWSTTKDDSGANYTDQDLFATQDSSITLYAIWETKEHTISYKLNGGINAVNNPSTYNIEDTIYFEDATREGHSFTAWYGDKNLITVVDSLPQGSQQDTILYAAWSTNSYDIVLHANNGNKDSIILTETYNTKVELPANIFTNENYTFKYWTKTITDDSNEVYYPGDSIILSDSTVNLYAQWQKYCSGNGTADTPWEICNTDHLLLLSLSIDDWDKHFIQTEDITFNKDYNNVDWDKDNTTTDTFGLSPIGNSNQSFTGSYNGQNHIISNLYINRELEDNIALFGQVNGTIKNIGLANIYVSGHNQVGSLIGESQGSNISNCYSNGQVLGNTFVGGLIGEFNVSNITNSYSTCASIGNSNTGGFIGQSSTSFIANSYSTGVVIANSFAGGFIGNSSATSISECFFDKQTSFQNEGSGDGQNTGIIPLETSEFSNRTHFSFWKVGAGQEMFPWLMNDEGRPHLLGQKNSVTNGTPTNTTRGYMLNEAYADSITQGVDSVGIRIRKMNNLNWLTDQYQQGVGSITSTYHTLEQDTYLAQAYSITGNAVTYGDMTLMQLYTLHFEPNGAQGTMADTVLIANDTIDLPLCTFTMNGQLHQAWSTEADGSGTVYRPQGPYVIKDKDETLHAQWTTPFAIDDFKDGIVAGAIVTLDVTENDTLGGVQYGTAFPVEILLTNTMGDVNIVGQHITYQSSTEFSGVDEFSYVVSHNGTLDTAHVVTLVFDAPGNMVNSDCYIEMPTYEWEIESPVESKQNGINMYTIPLVGNLYGDDYPEIVVAKSENTWYRGESLLIYDGAENSILNDYREIETRRNFNAATTAIAIAKINIGTNELRPTIFVADEDRKLSAYNPQNGNVYWNNNSANQTYCKALGGSSRGATPGIADFNNDGFQEVYAANSIYNAATGELICTGGTTKDIGLTDYRTNNTTVHYMMHTAAGDFNRDGDLELAAGRYVYDVDIASGNMTTMANITSDQSSNPDMIKDGATVIADIDLDGDLDVIVAHKTHEYDYYCYVWDGQTPELIAEIYVRNPTTSDNSRSAVSVPFVGDLNGDGRPEITFTTPKIQYAFSYEEGNTELQTYYALEHEDQSGHTGLTLFDFNNDGIAEIVYRDEKELRIINASGISHITGNDTLDNNTPILYDLATFPCESGTQSEFAVVVDIDLDDQAEIIVTNESNGERLNIFESGSNSKWVAARPVWNQYGYNVTNVNNDLSIPKYAINNSMEIMLDDSSIVRPYNHYLQQMGNVTLTGENVIPTPDLYIIDSEYTHNGITGTITFDIVNQGDAIFRNGESNICFYGGDPEDRGKLLAIKDINKDIEWEDTLHNQTYTFEADPNLYPFITVRLNDNGNGQFPDLLNLQTECNYDNNTELAAVFEISCFFSWNSIPLSNVLLNAAYTSDVDGKISFLVGRSDTIPLIPELAGYVFLPANDTIKNIQQNEYREFDSKKIPELLLYQKTVQYDGQAHDGNTSFSNEISANYQYRINGSNTWIEDIPTNVGVYDMKLTTLENELYTSVTDSIDSAIIITQRPIAFIIDVEDKEYDGTDTSTYFTITDTSSISDDEVYIKLNTNDLKFESTNVGTHNIKASDNWILQGKDAYNYTLLPFDSTTVASITHKELSITANKHEKFYDGILYTGGNGITAEGFVLGEDTSILTGNLNYDTNATSHHAVNQGIYTIAVNGFYSDNYNIIYIDNTLEIKKQFLYIEFKSSDNVIYGDSIDLTNYNVPNTTNLVPGDEFVYKTLGLAGDSSTTGHLVVGSHELNIGNAYIRNEAGDTTTENYNITFSHTYITVNKRQIHITGAEAQNKIYDGNNEAVIDSAILDEAIEGDQVFLSNATTGFFTQTDANNDIEVFYTSDVKIFGHDASNYQLMAYNSSMTADIYPKEIQAIGTIAHDKVYDKNRIAQLSNTKLLGVIPFDDVYVFNDTEGVFSQQNAGSNIAVNTYMLLDGTQKHNYYLTGDSNLVADIIRTPLNIIANDSTKIYDGLTFAGGNGITWNGFIAGEDTSDLSGSLSYTGTSQGAINIGQYNIKPTGFTSNNYSITYTDGTLNILPKDIIIYFNSQDTVTYGDNIIMSDYKPESNELVGQDTLVTDQLTWGTDLSSSNQLNVGQHILITDKVNALNQNGDTITNNYTFVVNHPTLTVTPKDLHIVDAVAQDKIYDKTADAIIDSATLVGVELGDDITLDNQNYGQFAQVTVGLNIAVTPDLTNISGVDITNYTLHQSPTLYADIFKRELSYIVDTASNKVYDGTDSLINVVNATTTDIMSGDDVSLDFNLVFSDVNAGEQWPILADTWNISGNDTSNYLLLPYKGDSADITLKQLNILANDSTKIYDGLTFAGGNGITWNGFIAGEDTSDLSGSLSYIGTSQGAINIGQYNIEPTGFTSNNYSITYTDGTLNILSKDIIIYFNGQDTVTYGDTIIMSDYKPESDGLVNQDTLVTDELNWGTDLSSSNQLNVGQHTLITDEINALNQNGDTITSNYTFVVNHPTLTVTPKDLHIVDAVAQDKVYDKTADAVVDSATLAGVEHGDDITLNNQTSGQFAQVTVGQNISVTPDLANISGADKNNYTLHQIPTLYADIFKRELSYTVDTASNKVYDGTDSLINVVNATTTDIISGDDVNLDFNLVFSDKNVGEQWPILAETWGISGNDTSNYLLLPYKGDSADITLKQLNILANDTTKIYDGTTFAGGNGITWSGFVTGEDTSDLSGSLSYIGTSQGAINIGSYAIEPTGFTSDNYSITYTNGTLNILPKDIIIYFNGQDTVTYGDTIIMSDYKPESDGLVNQDTLVTDELNWGTDLSSSNQLNVGQHILITDEVNALNQNGDTITSNYTFVVNHPTLTVTPKDLHIVDAVVQDKVYDKTADAVIDSATLVGVELGDDITLNNQTSGQFAQVTVGQNISVTPDVANISGADKNNYTLHQIPTLNADIFKRELNYSVDTASNKVYDGTDSLINVVNATTTDIISGDDVALDFNLVFSDVNVGEQWPILANTWNISGNDTSNYLLLPYKGDSADITLKQLNILANDSTKTYDGTTFAGGNGITWNGFIAGEDTSDLSGSLSYTGTSQGAINIGQYDIEPTGFTSDNYSITYTDGTLNILPKDIIIYFNGQDTVTYGDTIIMSDYKPESDGLVNQDTLVTDELNWGTDLSSSNQLNVGQHTLITDEVNALNQNGDTITNNYTFVVNHPTLTVIPKNIHIVGAVAQDKIYDKTAYAVIDSATLVGVELGDDITLNNQNSGQFAQVTVGQNVAVSTDLANISGTDKNNYTLHQSPILYADIFKRELSYTVDTASNKVYDSTDSLINVVNATTTDIINGDDVTLNFNLVFSDKNVGEQWPILADTWGISGNDTSNYLLLPYEGDSADITLKQLNILANDSTKIYDGLTFADGNGITWNGFVAGEDTSDLSGSLSYIGTSQGAINIGQYDIEPTGFSSNNYRIVYTPSSLTINKREILIIHHENDTLVYGTTINIDDYTPSVQNLALGDSLYVDSLTFGTNTSNSGNLQIGTHYLSTPSSYILNNEKDTVSQNYTYSVTPSSIYIYPRTVGIINAAAKSKVYDNTNKAKIITGSITNTIPGDSVSLSEVTDGIFDDMNVAKDIKVTIDSILLRGEDSHNYALGEQPLLQADITPRPLAYSMDSVINKNYDGTDSLIHELKPYTTDTFATDKVSLVHSFRFAQSNAMIDCPIISDNWHIVGEGASNYNLKPYINDTADITKVLLTAETIDITRKYGEANPNFELVLQGFVNNESVDDLDQKPAIICDYDEKSFVGFYESGIEIVKSNDTNYDIVAQSSDLTILHQNIIIEYMAEDTLVYGTEVNETTYDIIDADLVNNDTLLLREFSFGTDTSSSGYYNVGNHDIESGEIIVLDENKTIDVTENYAITFTRPKVTIIKKKAYIQLSTSDKIYDGNIESHVLYEGISDILSEDEVYMNLPLSEGYELAQESYLHAQFDNKNVGVNKNIALNSLIISGDDTSNYDIILPTLKAAINHRDVTIALQAADKVYDGTDAVIFSTYELVNDIPDDSLVLSHDHASFSQRDVANDIPITVSSFNISGESVSNYKLDTTYSTSANITKANLLVTPTDTSFIYGDEVPNLKWSYEGFVTGEDLNVIDTPAVLNTTIHSKSDVGVYTLKAEEEAVDNNYTFIYTEAKVMIEAREIEITYAGAPQWCENELLLLDEYTIDNVALGDTVSNIRFDYITAEDYDVESNTIFIIDLGEISLENEIEENVTNNYIIYSPSAEVEALSIPHPDLGPDLEFCGVCEYDFDAGEGISYRWSTGDTTRHISVQGNYKGYIWVEVENSNHCYNADSVGIAIQTKYYKAYVTAYIYPNPNNGKFRVDLSHSIQDYATIIDYSGKVVKKIWVDGDMFYVDINLADGVYLLLVGDAREPIGIKNGMAY